MQGIVQPRCIFNKFGHMCFYDLSCNSFCNFIVCLLVLSLLIVLARKRFPHDVDSVAVADAVDGGDLHVDPCGTRSTLEEDMLADIAAEGSALATLSDLADLCVSGMQPETANDGR